MRKFLRQNRNKYSSHFWGVSERKRCSSPRTETKGWQQPGTADTVRTTMLFFFARPRVQGEDIHTLTQLALATAVTWSTADHSKCYLGWTCQGGGSRGVFKTEVIFRTALKLGVTRLGCWELPEWYLKFKGMFPFAMRKRVLPSRGNPLDCPFVLCWSRIKLRTKTLLYK